MDEQGNAYFKGYIELPQNYVGSDPAANRITPGMTLVADIKTGEKTFCWIGVFESENAIKACRPKMIEQLDSLRHTLEEISPDLGVTDPASGPVVFDWKPD